MQNTIKLKRIRQVLMPCILFAMVLFVNQTYANQNDDKEKVVITGTVTEAATNLPLPGLAVVVKGTSIGTLTDLDGKYSIEVTKGSTLQFTYIGFITIEVLVQDQTVINAALESDIMGLEEVVVTGYGVQKKSDVTGSIASVSSKELNRVPVSGIDQALQGLAAGVNVIPVSGRPGDDAVIQIRGISSINGGEPLVIIDGVPGKLNNVAPSDIASLEVLKDASSAAIYGDMGGNGVILITTKQGKAGALKTTFNSYIGFESPVSKLDLMNSEQWMSTVEETYPGDIAQTSRPDTLPNYDWQDMFFQTGVSQNYDISTTGGNDISTCLIIITCTQ